MRKKLLLGLFALFCVVMGYSQTTVSGKITDAITGNPLGGVTVKGKGNPVSSISDADGKYSIKIAASIKTLVFSSVGYSDVEIPVKAGNIDVALNSAVSNLSEVIVTGFGGSQIKREVTGNIARVKGKDIEYMPTPSVDAALQGKAAGVFVNSQSGKLGQAVTVRVRGNSSISANSQPLYVLDGIPMTSNSQSSFGGATNPLTDINPNDIESIEVLKDASAGAIFGSRAANGVVLITTKKGRAGKTQVTFNYQTGAAEATKRLKMLNSEEYATLILEGAKYRDDLDGTPITDPSSWTAYVKNDVMDYYSYGNWSKDPKKSYDWQDAVFQKAPYRQADLQIRGGSDKTKFFSSFQHLQQAGTMIGNELSRTTGRLNIDQKVNDWLDMGVSLSLSRTYNKRLPDDNAFSNPLQAIALMPMTPFTDPNTGLPAGAPPGDVNIPLYYNPVLSVD
ncbi:MAG: TonB-dependent receptor, partial [Chitinophagaceae bacterium]